jgi:hypothetical protein
VLVALAGWVIFFLFYRGVADIDPDADAGDGTPPRETTSSSSSGAQSPRTAQPTGPPGDAAGMWPLRGVPWRATVPHFSGPIPLLRVRENARLVDDSGEASCSLGGQESREEEDG